MVQRHAPMVLRVCRRVLRHEQDAEDAFQATFLTLARRAAAVRKGEALASWLHGVACRTAASARRAAARRRAHEERARLAPVTAPGEEFAWREVQSALDEEVQRLPEKYRAVFVPCCLEGESRAEVARQLGEKEGTVSSRLAEARNLLRRRLSRRGITLSALLTAVAVTQGTGRGGVPAALARSTVRAAGMLARGAGAGVSHRVLTLIGRGGVNRPGLVTGALVLTLLAAGLVVGAVTTADQPPAGDSPVRSPVAALAPEEPVRTDRHGDPLPEGAVARIGTQRFRHGGGSINRVLPTPDGKMLVSKTYYGDASVLVWELATGRLLHQFPGHYEENRAVALSPDGKTLALGQDKVIRFYDLTSGKEVRNLSSSIGGTDELAFSPDGKVLASGHGCNTVLLWDLAGGKVQSRLQAEQNRVSNLVFSPDGKTLATGDTLDTLIRLFDVATGQERRQIRCKTDARDFAFSPDGATLAVGAHDGAASLWDVITGKPVRELHSPNKHVRSLTWSPDGKSLATSDLDAAAQVAAVRLWDPATGKELRQMQMNGTVGMAESLAFTADGKTLICGGSHGVIRLCDPATGSEKSPAGLPGPVWHVAVSPNGKTLAFSARDITLWDLATEREIGTLPEFHLSFAFAPDGKTLAGGGDDSTLNVWDVGNQRLVRRVQVDKEKEKLKFAVLDRIAFSPDGKVMATVGLERAGSEYDAAVRLWDTATGAQLHRHVYESHELATPDSIAFSPDGASLVTSGRGYGVNRADAVRVLDATGRQEQTRVQSVLNQSLGGGEQPRPGARSVLPRVSFSPDGRLLAMNRSEEGIPVWEMATGRERCLLKGHDGPTSAVAFSADGRTLASAGWDHTIRVWDVETATELKRLKGHRGLVNALAFTPDGRRLISAGDDSMVLFWDVLELTRRTRPAARLGPSEWDALWADLAAADAGKAHAALARLTAAPAITVTAVRERVRPAPEPDARLLARLVRDLDSEEFAAREKASQELARLGESAEAALKSARKGASPETARRCDELLTKLAVPSGDRLRGVRAVEVLERIGTPEAVTVLESLARGAPQARLTRDARAARDRLARSAGDR
ncbi:sigma-70 family RNA polymerase sigma factor [Gemmata sp. JC673]|uniref:Sigma-70 family RNA polymerase sigma factor n=1 Tax=Gemmata algarum TaxID=2975278 RepID=A0ABU5F6C4_9BACT|nr:sigma-70 family RNA polymerase sigma factor [Gemmata algarum]MDY3562865.1 sigma-70 family RNA polymerase sigma factor [Gemmata algarum]